jgi:hypothetical protein
MGKKAKKAILYSKGAKIKAVKSLRITSEEKYFKCKVGLDAEKRELFLPTSSSTVVVDTEDISGSAVTKTTKEETCRLAFYCEAMVLHNDICLLTVPGLHEFATSKCKVVDSSSSSLSSASIATELTQYQVKIDWHKKLSLENANLAGRKKKGATNIEGDGCLCSLAISFNPNPNTNPNPSTTMQEDQQQEENGASSVVCFRVDILTPMTGRVLELNEAILKDPSLVLSDPVGRGFLAVLLPDRAVPAIGSDLAFAEKNYCYSFLKGECKRENCIFLHEHPPPSLP